MADPKMPGRMYGEASLHLGRPPGGLRKVILVFIKTTKYFPKGCLGVRGPKGYFRKGSRRLNHKETVCDLSMPRTSTWRSDLSVAAGHEVFMLSTGSEAVAKKQWQEKGCLRLWGITRNLD